jgi:DNA-3-methyladenine glycosylase II
MATASRTLSPPERALARRDPVLRAIMRQAGPAPIGKRRSRTNFEALARAIVFQQLAGKAAAAIYGRFENLFDGVGPSAEGVTRLSYESMRSVGLSNAKVLALQDLAAKTLDGTVPRRGISKLDDEEIIERLSAVRGIGRWTAEMFLLFQLGRPDVWPVDDLGVRNGYRIAYELPSMPTAKELAPLGDRFKPYRSYAAWYCWQAVHIARGDMVTPGS